MRARLLVALSMLAAVVPTRSARAEPTVEDQALAQSLFDEGRALMQAGKYHQACAKFMKSYRVDPGGGTLLNLALCHDREGRVATAYAEYNDALSQALRDGRTDREQFARKRIAALEPIIPHIRLSIAGGAPRGVRVLLDGASLAPDAIGASLPIDPGRHVFVVRAPGMRARSVTVDVESHSKVTQVVIPALEDEPVVPAPAASAAPAAPSAVPALLRQPRAPVREQPHGGHKTLGFVVGAAGLAALGTGAGFGIDALAKQRAANDKCPATNCGDPSAVASSQRAATEAWISDAAIAAGVLGVGIGVYLVLSAPTPVRAAVQARPGGVAVNVEF